MTREKAIGIALGNINPISGEVMADFSPQKIKVCSDNLWHFMGEMFHMLNVMTSRLRIPTEAEEFTK